jgi:hypothetical protein
MQAAAVLTPKSLFPFLLNVAPVLPVFIWGPPGIGKSALVRAFAEAIGLVCVSLLGSQLAPEDIIGVPQVTDGKSRFCPPTIIAREATSAAMNAPFGGPFTAIGGMLLAGFVGMAYGALYGWLTFGLVVVIAVVAIKWIRARLPLYRAGH